MKIILRLALMLVCMMTMATPSHAQSEPEYMMEAGAGVGLMSYEGDFNGNILKCMQPTASLLLRRMFNPRQGFRFALGYGKLKGSSEDSNTVYPDYSTPGYEHGDVYRFDNSLVDFNVTYEYNFWPYGTGKEYRGAKKLTPFIFLGLGATYVNGGGNSAMTMNVPMGLGIKYKIAQRLNLNVDWTMHFSMSDKLDGIKDPYLVQTSGMFKNSDCYSTLKVSLTYSFKEKCKVCHNEDE